MLYPSIQQLRIHVVLISIQENNSTDGDLVKWGMSLTANEMRINVIERYTRTTDGEVKIF